MISHSVEGVSVEEISRDICLLLRKEDSRALRHLHLLLHRYPCMCAGPRSSSSQIHRHLRAVDHHHP